MYQNGGAVMRKAMLYEQLVILIVCFMAGVGSYYLFEPAEMIEFVRIIDTRVLEPQNATNQQTVLLAFGSFFMVFLLGTNPLFIWIAKIVVAARICFFGLSSIILLQSNEEILFYSVWWFPFQFVYSMICLMFVYRLLQWVDSQKKQKQRRLAYVMPYFVVYSILVVGELLVLRYFVL